MTAFLSEVTGEGEDVSPILVVSVSLIFSGMLVLGGFAADVARLSASGTKRFVLTIAALTPMLLVLVLTSCYLSALLALGEEDEMGTDAILKYLLPAFVAVIAHLTVFVKSDQIEEAILAGRRAVTEWNFRRNWLALRRDATALTVSVTESERETRRIEERLVQLNGGADVSRQRSRYWPSLEASLLQAHFVLQPGDPFKILSEIEALAAKRSSTSPSVEAPFLVSSGLLQLALLPSEAPNTHHSTGQQ